jgi:hypothetical protein
MLNNMKAQLTDCKLRKAKNFFFGSVLCTFFFEWVPMMSPQNTHTRTPTTMANHGPMDRAHSSLGGGKMSNPYDDDFFSWWERQLPLSRTILMQALISPMIQTSSSLLETSYRI